MKKRLRKCWEHTNGSVPAFLATQTNKTLFLSPLFQKYTKGIITHQASFEGKVVFHAEMSFVICV